MKRSTFLKGLAAAIAGIKVGLDLFQYGPQIPYIHKTYASEFVITQSMIEDDMYYKNEQGS